MDKKKDAIVKTIENAKSNARKTGDENLNRLAKSRQKKLDDRWGIERSAKGGRCVHHLGLIVVHMSDHPVYLEFALSSITSDPLLDGMLLGLS